MKRFIGSVFLILLVHAAVSMPERLVLSDSSRISLLTCSPGEDLYSAFGHTGIRVTDYKQGFDVVFNYGTFDFNQPGFYTNFVKGKMLYMVAVEDFRSFHLQYDYEERSVKEQELTLPDSDKAKIFDLLYENAKPENCQYLYDFFWDNCATRPRDIFEKALGSKLTYDTLNGDFEKNKTMHDMLRLFVHNRPWVDYGFDLILGLPCEIEASPRHQTFLPEYLSRYMATGRINNEPLSAGTVEISKKPALPDNAMLLTPLTVNCAFMLFALLLTYFEQKNGTYHRWFDFTLFFILGMVGTLFLALWMFSEHYSVPKNLNLFWLIPTHLLFAFGLLWKPGSAVLTLYAILTSVLAILILLLWFASPQPFNPAIIPLLIIIIVRSISISKIIRPKTATA